MCQNLYALPVCTEKGRYLKEKNFMDDRERLNIVIMQMVEHNKVHVENYAKWARFAKTNQLDGAGALLDEVEKLAAHVGITLRRCLSHLSLAEPAGDIEKGI